MAIDRPIEAEAQHLWFCRALEKHTWAPHEREQPLLQQMADRAPLYLFSKETAERCSAYHREQSPQLQLARPGTLLVDHMGAVLIELTHRVDDVLGVVATTVAYMQLDPDPGRGTPGVEAVTITTGHIYLRASHDPMAYDVRVGDIVGAAVQVRGKRLDAPIWMTQPEQLTLAERDFRKSVITALEQLNYTRRPRQVIVEDSPRKIRPAQKGSVSRSADRPVRLLLDVDQAVRLRTEARAGSHASPAPHHRRAHTRTLRHPKWGDKVGTVLSVKDSEVGVKPGEEIELPRRIYHVVSVGGVTTKENL